MSLRRVAALLGVLCVLAAYVFVSQPADAALLSPTITSVTPPRVVPGINNQTLTLHGDNFSSNSKVSFSPDTGIAQTGPLTISGDMTTITMAVNVTADAPNTARDVTVSGGLFNTPSTCQKCLTVGPDITAVSGPIANTNESAPFTISGHAFKAPVSVTVSRSGYGYNAAETDSILATTVSVAADGTSISATVNMLGRAPGRWKVAISQDNGGTASFGDGITTGMQVTGSKPTLASISPTRIDPNQTNATFALTGAGFARGMVATVSGSGVTQSAAIALGTLPGGKLDQTKATLKLSSTASPSTGPQTIVLRNADGQSSTNTDALCVNCNLPTGGTPSISAVSPQIVGQGATNLQMTVTGTNFAGPVPTVTFSPSTGVSATVTRDSATQLTLNLTTTTAAVAGNYDLTVTNPNGGGSATKTAAFAVHTDFRVVSVAPPGRPQNSTGVVVVNGSGFTGTPTVSITSSNNDVTVSNVVVDSPAKLHFTATVTANADTTAHRDVTVTQSGTPQTCTGCFTVGKNPTVVSIAPTAATGGGPATVTITGTNIADGATASLEQTGQPSIPMTEAQVSPPTTVSGTFDLTNAAPGHWNVRVTNADGGTDVLANGFTVTQAAPTVSGVTPESLPQKAQTTLTLTGTAFSPGMKVTFASSNGLTVDQVTRKSNTSAEVKVTASDTAALGARDVTVTNTDNQSGTCQSCVVVVQGQQSQYFGGGVTAYPNFNGGAFVAAGNLDGVPSNGVEFITGANAGGGPHVKPYRVNPANGNIQELGDGFMAYDPHFGGGVHVAIGNIDGDMSNGEEIVTGAGPGGGPHVRIFHLNNDLSVTEPYNGFFAYDPAFGGGVWVATADVNGDGKDEIITGAGAGGGPHVRVWKLAADGKSFTELAGFMAYDPHFGGGVAVAGGNFVAEDPEKPVLDEIATVPASGGGPHVRVFAGNGAVKREFMAFGSSDPLGYRVAAGDFDFDTVDDLAISQVSSSYVLIAQLVDPPQEFSVMAQPQPLGAALAIGTNMAGADVDGDGDDDLIVSPDHNSAVTIRLTRPLS
ncbi:MAG TPA: IPT/TIG domain-containing protein [Acidimicrobiales bacterium]|nr:IPT/TIG domain-containing protein [Acidimicrobiales bacterium]